MNTSKIDTFEKCVDRYLERLGVARAQYKEAITENEQALSDFEAAEAALAIAQSTAKEIQERVHGRISAVVSKCVATVFGEAYSFEIQFEEKRSKTEARLVLFKDGQERDPLTECGGGVVDIISFALRVAAVSLHRPRIEKLLVLDEPFRFVSKAYKPAAAELLQTLSEEMDMQIILITHEPDFEIGEIVELT